MRYGYVLPLLYIVPVYVATWYLIRGSFNLSPFLERGAETVGFPSWPRLATFGLDVPLLLTFGIFSRFTNTLGEELGWRGFLLPHLSRRYGFTAGCFVTGVIWALWHYPLLFAFGFFERPNVVLQIGFFTIMVIGLSFVIGWLKLKTNSLWPCVLLHASHNVLRDLFRRRCDRDHSNAGAGRYRRFAFHIDEKRARGADRGSPACSFWRLSSGRFRNRLPEQDPSSSREPLSGDFLVL